MSCVCICLCVSSVGCEHHSRATCPIYFLLHLCAWHFLVVQWMFPDQDSLLGQVGHLVHPERNCSFGSPAQLFSTSAWSILTLGPLFLEVTETNSWSFTPAQPHSWQCDSACPRTHIFLLSQKGNIIASLVAPPRWSAEHGVSDILESHP